MKPPNIPLEKIIALGNAQSAVIPTEHLDANGHMNIKHYMAVFESSWYPFAAQFGITPDFYAHYGTGGFDLEHHLHYLAEVHAGETVAVYTRLIGRTAKRIHGMMFMVNESQHQLAATFEFVSVYVDLNTRRSAPYPDAISHKLDAMLSAQHHLDWEAPLCGIMSA